MAQFTLMPKSPLSLHLANMLFGLNGFLCSAKRSKSNQSYLYTYLVCKPVGFLNGLQHLRRFTHVKKKSRSDWCHYLKCHLDKGENSVIQHEKNQQLSCEAASHNGEKAINRFSLSKCDCIQNLFLNKNKTMILNIHGILDMFIILN